MMKETVKELNEKFKQLSEKYSYIDKAMDNLSLIDFDDHEKKRSMIDDLRQKGKKIQTERQNILNALTALEKICTHINPDGKSAFHGSGNDSHYSYEKCEICGKEEC